jgi:plasmid stabilization system protein ParE
MVAKRLFVHPAFYRRVRHYRERLANESGRPNLARKFVEAAQELIAQLLENPGRGHLARFEAPDLADIHRSAVPGFSVFAIFYRWDRDSLTIITLEHGAQDLPSRLARVLATPPSQ